MDEPIVLIRMTCDEALDVLTILKKARPALDQDWLMTPDAREAEILLRRRTTVDDVMERLTECLSGMIDQVVEYHYVKGYIERYGTSADHDPE